MAAIYPDQFSGGSGLCTQPGHSARAGLTECLRDIATDLATVSGGSSEITEDDAAVTAEADAAVTAVASAVVTAVADAAVTAAPDATDDATVWALANDLKAKYNLAVALINDLKSKYNLSVALTNDLKAKYNAEVALTNDLKAKYNDAVALINELKTAATTDGSGDLLTTAP